MSTTAVRRTIFMSILVALLAIVIVGIALLTGVGTIPEPRHYFALTAEAIYATNTQVSIFNFQTMEVEGWTKTPTPTPTPNRQ